MNAQIFEFKPPQKKPDEPQEPKKIVLPEGKVIPLALGKLESMDEGATDEIIFKLKEFSKLPPSHNKEIYNQYVYDIQDRPLEDLIQAAHAMSLQDMQINYAYTKALFDTISKKLKGVSKE